MNINSSQYRQASKGCFLSLHRPEEGESLILNVLTSRGRRLVPVGQVQRVEAVGSTRCLVWVSQLAFVDGMNY